MAGRASFSTPAAALLVLLLAAPAAAFEPTGDLVCIALDAYGQPLVDASLTLQGGNLQGARTATTDAEGRAVFRALPPGRYTVAGLSPDGATTRLEGLELNAGRTVSVRLPFSAPEISETVTVEGKPPLVDVERTTSSQTFDRGFLDKFGWWGESIAGIVSMTPGVLRGTSVRGATYLENVYVLDGVDTSSPSDGTMAVPIPFNAVQEAQVQTGAFDAEQGRATGGVTSVVTKSGGNEFSGVFNVSYWSSRYIQHMRYVEMPLEQRTSDLSLGGPIVRDRLWFFVSGLERRTRWGWDGAPTIMYSHDNSRVLKLTWQASPAHKITLEHVAADNAAKNAGTWWSNPYMPEATYFSDTDDRLTSARYLGTFGTRWVVQAQVSHWGNEWTASPRDPGNNSRPQWDLWTGWLRGNSISSSRDYDERDGVKASAERSGARHTVKTGLEVEKHVVSRFSTWNGGGYDLLLPDASGVLVPVISYDEIFPKDQENHGGVAAVFVQDKWRVHPKLTLSGALRYDAYQYDDDRGREVYDSGLLQPRFGLAWDPKGDARSAVKLSAARLGQPSIMGQLHFVNEGQQGYDTYVNERVGGYPLGLGPIPVDFDGDGVIEDRVLVESWRGRASLVYGNGGSPEPTHVDELTLSYERQVRDSWWFSATGIQRWTHDIVEDSCDPISGICRADNLSALKREYSGIELVFRGQRGAWMLYTWGSVAWSRGNIDMGLRWQTSWEYDLPESSITGWGYLADDARYSFKVSGSWTAPKYFETVWNFSYRSGLAENVLVPVSPYGYAFLGGRGTQRTSHLDQLNVELRAPFRIKKVTVQPAISVLNVFDSKHEKAYKNSEGDPHPADEFQMPRQFRAALKVSF